MSNLTLDNLEFRSPIATIQKADIWDRSIAEITVLFDQVWQRRLKSLWNYVTGLRTSATLDFPNTLAGQSSQLTISLPGAAIGDFAQASPGEASLVIANTSFAAAVTAAGVVTVSFINSSAGAINPPSGIVQIRVISQ